jgi:TolA-binding protein
MKTLRIHILFTALIHAVALSKLAASGIPVVDAASLANDKMSHMETIAKWAENISQLRKQIDQLNQQINIQNDALMFRRYSVLDAKQQTSAQVADATRDRSTEQFRRKLRSRCKS